MYIFCSNTFNIYINKKYVYKIFNKNIKFLLKHPPVATGDYLFL
jgi:hypothetical protein